MHQLEVITNIIQVGVILHFQGSTSHVFQCLMMGKIEKSIWRTQAKSSLR